MTYIKFSHKLTQLKNIFVKIPSTTGQNTIIKTFFKIFSALKECLSFHSMKSFITDLNCICAQISSHFSASSLTKKAFFHLVYDFIKFISFLSYIFACSHMNFLLMTLIFQPSSSSFLFLLIVVRLLPFSAPFFIIITIFFFENEESFLRKCYKI